MNFKELSFRSYEKFILSFVAFSINLFAQTINLEKHNLLPNQVSFSVEKLEGKEVEWVLRGEFRSSFVTSLDTINNGWGIHNIGTKF